MELRDESIRERSSWEDKGYKLPEYDRAAMIRESAENPCWIHFGAGNIFRAYQAKLVQRLLESGAMQQGVIVAEGYDPEIISDAYHPFDDLSIAVTLKPDGHVEKEIVGSIAESHYLDPEQKNEWARLQDIFRAPSLQMVTFSITEKGYRLADGSGNIYPEVSRDYSMGPAKPVSYIGRVTSLLYCRYKANRLPVAMVSMDNCSHNGDVLYHAVKTMAEHWVENSAVERQFLDYIDDRSVVTFPWTMIDKITPRPSESIAAMLERDGIEQMQPHITAQKTYIAPFVNAEECEYLVIEDMFPNGRPQLEKAGVIFADRETVDKAEKMKVCTCLNPPQTALAIFGCLLGYRKISEEMKDPLLVKLITRVGYVEGLPVVVDPVVLSAKDFIDEVFTQRLINPFIPDTPQRIASDTSQKLSIRFGETIKAYQRTDPDRVKELRAIPLIFAGWLRYLTGIDDMGNAFTLSPDPLLKTVCPYVSELKVGSANRVEEAVRPLLENKSIFGVNLYQAGLAEKVCDYLTQMLGSNGAVRLTLERNLDF